MKTNKFVPIVRIVLLILLLVVVTSIYKPSDNSILAKTAVDNQFYGPTKSAEIAKVNSPECEGVWFNSATTQKIFLNSIYLKDWGANTNPSLILDSLKNTQNYLIIGHNICQNGACDQARSQFANIMKLNVGDSVSACLGGFLYTGYIFTSGPIPDTRTEVMWDWAGFNSITLFTSYGNCKDSKCSSTNQRWMVAFERN